VTLVTIILPFPSHTTTGHFSFCIVFEGVPFPTSLPLQTFYRSYPPRDQSIAPRSATRPVFVLPVEETQLNQSTTGCAVALTRFDNDSPSEGFHALWFKQSHRPNLSSLSILRVLEHPSGLDAGARNVPISVPRIGGVMWHHYAKNCRLVSPPPPPRLPPVSAALFYTAPRHTPRPVPAFKPSVRPEEGAPEIERNRRPAGSSIVGGA